MTTQVEIKKDRRLFLKVKIKSLAAESKIIRKEEKLHPLFREELYLHRKFVVAREARATLLAYSFLRGIPYKKVESNCDSPPDWSRVKTMVLKYGKDFSRPIWSVDDKKRIDEVTKDLEKWAAM